MIDYVALTIRGVTLDPEEVTRRLGIQPSQAFARGDSKVHPTPSRFGYWRLRIQRNGGELNSLLKELVDLLDGRENDIAELARSYEAVITIVADLTDISEGEMSISGSVLKALALTAAQLRFYWLYGVESKGSTW